jgi:hypothetical protein
MTAFLVPEFRTARVFMVIVKTGLAHVRYFNMTEERKMRTTSIKWLLRRYIPFEKVTQGTPVSTVVIPLR